MINRKYFDENLKIIIDLKPALDVEQLNKRILRDFEEELKKFQPSLEVEDIQDAVYQEDLTDMTDILREVIEQTK